MKTNIDQPITSTYYDLDQIRESCLLSPERMAAIERDIESRLSHPQTPAGAPIKNAFLVDFGGGKSMLFPSMDHDPEGRYMRRQLLPVVLTQDELRLIDEHCSSAGREHRDAARFEKAVKVSWKEWKGGVWWGDDYFSEVEEALDRICWDDPDDESDNRGRPRYLWAAQALPVIPGLDVSNVVEHYVSDAWEDCDTNDLNGVAELQKALDQFVEANATVLKYEPDYTTAILLDGAFDEETHDA